MIETERLLLRPPEPHDAAAVYRIVSDPEVMHFISPNGATGTFADAVERIERLQHRWQVDGFGHLMAVRKETGTAVGQIGLLVWDPSDWHHDTRQEIGDKGELELGWTLERAAWGHGYATEGALAVRDWVLRELQPPRLISLIHPDNVGSIAVAKRVGEEYQHDVVLGAGVTVGLWQLASQP